MGFRGWRTSSGISIHPLHEKYATATEMKPNFPFKHAFLNNTHPQNSSASLPLLLGPLVNSTHIQDQGKERDVLPESPPGARQLVLPVSVEEGTESGKSDGERQRKKHNSI